MGKIIYIHYHGCTHGGCEDIDNQLRCSTTPDFDREVENRAAASMVNIIV